MQHPIEACVFDVFGTVVNWMEGLTAELEILGRKHGVTADWSAIAQEWYNGHRRVARLVAEGKLAGPLNVDVVHKEILDELLEAPQWSHLGRAWDENTRQHLNLAWHRLNGKCPASTSRFATLTPSTHPKGWPDTVEGLHALKKHAIIATLSNGNVRLLIDMAKHAGLPWDTILSTELFGSFKPDPKIYLEAMRHLAVAPARCAMVAAHIYDLRAAAALGMVTIYVRRATEDIGIASDVRSKRDGGEVDYVVDSFIELAEVISKHPA